MSLPKPYYEDEEHGIVIYNADCRDILPHLPKVDLVLTDPPYGIDYNPTFKKWNGDKSSHKKIHGDNHPFDPSFLVALGGDQVIWGGDYWHNILPLGGWFVWDKRCSEKADKMFGLPIEMAWTTRPGRAIIRLLHGGLVNDDSLSGLADPRHHPTQKPVRLMSWCLSFFPEAKTVLDPFMGSGTTLVAAKNLGLKAIGIEIEERYCEIAARRLSQGMLFGQDELAQIGGGK